MSEAVDHRTGDRDRRRRERDTVRKAWLMCSLVSMEPPTRFEAMFVDGT